LVACCRHKTGSTDTVGGNRHNRRFDEMRKLPRASWRRQLRSKDYETGTHDPKCERGTVKENRCCCNGLRYAPGSL
jgi:hypothetical protein